MIKDRILVICTRTQYQAPISLLSPAEAFAISFLSLPNTLKTNNQNNKPFVAPTAVASTVGQPECPSKPQDPIPSPPSTDHLLTNLLLSFSDSQATKIVELAVARARISVRPCFKAQIRLQASGSQLCQGSQPFPPCSLMENIKGRVV